MGYRVAAGLFTAREVGAPHERERIFIMGHRDALALTETQRWEEFRTPTPGVALGGYVTPWPPGPDPASGFLSWPTPMHSNRPAFEVGNWTLRGLALNPTAWRDVVAADPSLAPEIDERGWAWPHPEFIEWLMGFPRGWTAGLGREARLSALGNAVVPAVAALAWRELWAALES